MNISVYFRQSCQFMHMLLNCVSANTMSHHSTVLNVTFCTSAQARLAGGAVMFSVCPSVGSFVRPSVHSTLWIWTQYFENEWTDFDANWHNCFTGQRNNQLFWAGAGESRSHEAEYRNGGLAEASFSIPLGRVAFLVLLHGFPSLTASDTFGNEIWKLC